MKIRIKGNTLRLRLSQTELRKLREEGVVSESIVFGPGQTLQYSLQISQSVKAPSSDYQDQLIRVLLPSGLAAQWINSDQVSIQSDQANDSPHPLALLVEKDFKCLTERPGENEEDLFPHPKEGGLDC